MHHTLTSRIGPRETSSLVVTTVFFASSVTLAAFGLPVDQTLILLTGTAGASVVTVAAMTAAGAVRSAREAEREAVAALARLAGQV
ncbi:hypothetical protein ACGFYU_02245 [Streptomyces sp. NPDC048337]|uniref:hypothetical protein n=1 Tax=Streptomyces sp. NPDC048337 TaxID=3365535 RepID=UPI003723B7D7